MTYIKANWQEIENCGNRFGRCGNLLNQYNNQVRSAKRSLSWQIKMQTNYDNQLGNLSSRLTSLQQQMQLLQRTAAEVARQYRNTEMRIRGEAFSETGTEEAEGSSGHNWWELLGGAGVLGGVSTGILDFINSDDPMWIRVANGLESLIGVADDVAEFVDDGGTDWWSLLLGCGNVADDIDPNGNLLSQLWSEEFSGYIFESGDSIADNIGTVAQWAGVITAGIGAAYGNWQEYQSGEIDLGRAIGEFVVETGAEVLIDAGVGALVTAGLVTAIGSAPAILVAAGTAGAVWLLDAASQELFGVDATEAIGNAVMDGVEWLGDQAESIGTTITDGISDGVEWLGDQMEDIGSTISEGFDDAKEWLGGLFA